MADMKTNKYKVNGQVESFGIIDKKMEASKDWTDQKIYAQKGQE